MKSKFFKDNNGKYLVLRNDMSLIASLVFFIIIGLYLWLAKEPPTAQTDLKLIPILFVLLGIWQLGQRTIIDPRHHLIESSFAGIFNKKHYEFESAEDLFLLNLQFLFIKSGCVVAMKVRTGNRLETIHLQKFRKPSNAELFLNELRSMIAINPLSS